MRIKQGISVVLVLAVGALSTFYSLYSGESGNADVENKAIVARKANEVAMESPPEGKQFAVAMSEIISEAGTTSGPPSESTLANADTLLTPEQKTEYYELSSRMISDLASQATTLPEILNSKELEILPLSAQVYVVGNILMAINKRALDLEIVWPN